PGPGRVPTGTTTARGPARAALRPAAGQFVPTAGQPLLRTRLAAGATTSLALAGPGMPVPAEVSAVALSIETDASAADGTLAVGGPGSGDRPALHFARGGRSRTYDLVRTPADGRLSLTTSAATGITVRLRGYYTSAQARTVGSTFVALPESPVRTDTAIRAGGATTVTLSETAGLPAATNVAAVAVSLSVRAPRADGCVSAQAGSVRTGASLCFRKGADAVALDTLIPTRQGRIVFRSDQAVRLSVRVRGYHAVASAPVAGATFVPLDEPALLGAEVAPGRPAAATMARPDGVTDLGSVSALLVSTDLAEAGKAGCLTIATAGVRRGDTGPTACFGAGDSAGGTGLVRVDRSGRFRGSATAGARAQARIEGYFRMATAPAAPTAVKAVATRDGAVVSWTAPETDSGAGVTGYTVKASPGTATARTDGTTRATVGGLTEGTAYTFTVVATNAAGSSPASAPSAKATPSLAAAPPAVAGSAADVTGTLTVGGSPLSLAVPADSRAVYSFTGTAGQKIFTTAGVVQGDDGYARVELTSPTGAVLASRAYLRHDPGNATNFDVLTLTVTGTYKITFTPDPGTVNTYQARVSAVPADATATVTVGGAARPVTTTAAGQLATVSFTGTAGAAVIPRVHIDSPAAGACVRAAVRDPNGNYTQASDCAAEGWISLGRADLSTAGTWTVEVDPSEAWTGTVSVSVLPVPADRTVAAATDGNRFSAAVTYGQGVAFSFTGTAGAVVHGVADLDGTDADLSGRLYDSTGKELTGCWTCAESFELALPATGTYTWRVVPRAGDVGTLGVTLDVVPPPLRVTGSVNGPAVRMASAAYWQSVVLSFPVAAGQRVYISCTPEQERQPSFLLRSPAGVQLSMSTCATGSLLFDQTFTTAGTYQLEMAYPGRRLQAATVRLQLPSAPATATATIGGPAVTVTTTAAGQLAEVRFTATAGQRAYVECTQTLAGGQNSWTDVQMIAPSGNPVGWTAYCSGTDQQTVQTFTFGAGTYTYRITPSGTATGTFTVRLRPVPAAVTATATMGGSPVSVTTTAIGQEALIRFTATAGQRLYVACLQDIPRTNWGWTRYYLVDPSGRQVGIDEDCPNGNDLFPTQTLTTTGTYTIEVHPSGASFGTARLQLYNVPADATATATIGGSAVSLATTTPGQQMRVSFNATAGDRVYLTCQQQKLTGKSTENVWYSLTDPTGEMPEVDSILDVMRVSGNCVDPLSLFDFRVPPTLFTTQVLERTGTYTVTVDPENLVTANTKIQIYRVPAESTATAVVGGPAVTVSTTAIGQEARVDFTAVPGQRIFISCTQRLTNNKGERPLYLLADGSSWQVSYCEREPALFDTQAFTTGGAMSLVIQPRGLATGTFTIRLYAPAADVSRTATIGGGPVTVTTADPGQRGSVTFTGTAGQRLYATCGQSMTGAGSQVPEYRLVGPDGATAGVADCSSPPALFDTQVLTKSGTYRIEIAPPGIATGSFTIRLYSPPANVSVTATIDGPAVTATMTVPGQKALVSFTGVAGRRLYVRCAEELADLGDGFTNYVLSGPDGAQVAFGLCAGPPTLFDTLDLLASGTYQISVAPPGVATGTVTLQLYGVPADATQTATIGGAAKTLTTTKVGQKAFLTFSATANQPLRVSCAETVSGGDGLTPFYELRDPSGAPVAFGECLEPADLFGPVTLADAGTYTVAIYPPGLATGSYTLQLFSS
ncbi:fibronectin type III domain-containing protein, partial [Actinoplanes sp. NPDC004185]